MTRKSEIQKEREIALTVPVVVAAAMPLLWSWSGRADGFEVWVHDGSLPCKLGGSYLFGVLIWDLELRLKRCSFRLWVLCFNITKNDTIWLWQVCFYFSLKRCSFGTDVAKIKHISTMMCQLTTKTNQGVLIANRTKL